MQYETLGNGGEWQYPTTSLTFVHIPCADILNGAICG